MVALSERIFIFLIDILNDFKDSLEMKEALKESHEFLSLDEIDKELKKTGLI